MVKYKILSRKESYQLQEGGRAPAREGGDGLREEYKRVTLYFFKMWCFREFPGGPVVRTLQLHYQGPSSISVWRTYIPQTV